MPIEIIPKLNIQSYSRVKKINTKCIESQSPIISQPADTCKIENTTAYLSDIFNSIYGIYSNEDISKINKLRQNFSLMNRKDLQILRQTSIKSYVDEFSEKLKVIKKEENKDLCIFNPLNLTENCRREMKDSELRLVAMRQAYLNEYPEMLWLPYSKWVNCNFGCPCISPAKSIYEHPCDKILRLTGIFSADDIKDINRLYVNCRKKPVLKVIKEKFKILNEIQKYFKGKNPDFIGQFSDKEYKAMKKLAKKYYALNRVQTSLGYFTKSLESVLYSETYDLKPEKYINGIGFITDEKKVDGKNTVIALFHIGFEYMFRMYDKDILEMKNDFMKTLPKTFSLETLNNANQQAKTIIDKEPKGLIAEIHFEIMNKEKIMNFLRCHKVSEDYADKVLGDNKYAYTIRSFRNFYKGQSASAGKYIGIKLLSFLKNTDAKPILLSAHPFVGTHSPVSMYLYMGFKPLSKSEEEINKSMKGKKYIDKTPLVMYSPDFEIIGKKVDKLNNLYFQN